MTRGVSYMFVSSKTILAFLAKNETSVWLPESFFKKQHWFIGIRIVVEGQLPERGQPPRGRGRPAGSCGCLGLTYRPPSVVQGASAVCPAPRPYRRLPRLDYRAPSVVKGRYRNAGSFPGGETVKPARVAASACLPSLLGVPPARVAESALLPSSLGGAGTGARAASPAPSPSRRLPRLAPCGTA